MNLLCFGNSKLYFSAHVHENYPRIAPVAVHVSFHEDPAERMQALIARFVKGDDAAMKPLLIERLSKKQRALCTLPRKFDAAAATTSKPAAYVLSHGPWAWSGTPPLRFKSNGALETPWGGGSWGVLDDTHLFADFVGSRHNIEFEPGRMGRFTSSRCGDGDPVVGSLVDE